MSFIQARISQRFGAQLARLPAGERKKIGNAGGHRLVYLPASKDAHEQEQKLDGHVDVLGIGDPHNGSGFNQVNKLSDVNWW